MERVLCLVANLLAGPLESIEVGSGPPSFVSDGSRLINFDSNDFMDVPRFFLGLRILLGFSASVPLLSKSEESESQFDLEETWMSF